MNHDQNFKNLILDYLRPSLDFFARPEAEIIPETGNRGEGAAAPTASAIAAKAPLPIPYPL